MIGVLFVAELDAAIAQVVSLVYPSMRLQNELAIFKQDHEDSGYFGIWLRLASAYSLPYL